MIDEKGPKYLSGQEKGREKDVTPEDTRKAFIEMMEKIVGPENAEKIVAEAEVPKNSLYTIRRPKSETGIEALARERIKELVRKYYGDYKIAEEDGFIDDIIVKFKQEVGGSSRYNLDDTTLEGFTRASINEVREERQRAMSKDLEKHKKGAEIQSLRYGPREKDDEDE